MELKQCPVCFKFKFLAALPDGTVLPCKKCAAPKTAASRRAHHAYVRRSFNARHADKTPRKPAE